MIISSSTLCNDVYPLSRSTQFHDGFSGFWAALLVWIVHWQNKILATAWILKPSYLQSERPLQPGTTACAGLWFKWQTAYKFRLGFPYALGCYIKCQPFFQKKKALNLSVIVCVQCLHNNSGEFFRVPCVKGTHLWLLKWGVSKETLYILLRAEYGNIQEVEESSMLKTVAKTRKSF